MPFRVKTAAYCTNYREETIKIFAKNTVSDAKLGYHFASGDLKKRGNIRGSACEVRSFSTDV